MDNEPKTLNTKIDDQLLSRKRHMTCSVQRISGIPLPSIVEISESGVCNRKCSFCPRSDPEFAEVNDFIRPELVEKLASELAEINYSGLVLFSGFVEPMLDKHISNHISVLREKLPYCRIEMVTNGDPLNIANLNKLAHSGLDSLLVSCYDGPHQIEEILSMLKASELPKERVIFRQRWSGPDENFNISLSNRGGMMKTAEYQIDDLHKPWDNPCFYPSYMFFMDYQGDVLMCAHDWGKKAIAGNLNVEKFIDIWSGPKFSRWRKSLLAGDRRISPCDVCNVEGTRMGAEHAAAWEDYHEDR